MTIPEDEPFGKRPIRLCCARCGAYLDELRAVLNERRFVKVPRSEYILFSATCTRCQNSFALACRIAEDVPEDREEHVPGLLDALRRRYQTAVDEVVLTPGETFLCDGGMFENKGRCLLDPGFLDHAADSSKPPVIPMEALALARGLRRAALEDRTQAFCASVGELNLSVAVTEDGASPSLQLSVFDRGASEPLDEWQFRFAASLVFAAEETKKGHRLSCGRVREILVPLAALSAEDLPPAELARRHG
ncbi:MAG TPA: hypothetical protein VNL14_10450 [Candidatus Acidoferrales bacterium]|nr:hypothetical protein [Candidatus Acidoferrales bacterium]